MMKKQLKWIIAIVVVIAVILMITYYQLYVTNTVYSAGISSKKIQQFDSSIAKLDKDNTIHQFFTAKRNNMERISLLFQDDENTKSGKIVIKLKNVTDDIVVKDETIEYVRTDREQKRIYSIIGSDLKYEFEFERQKNSKGKEYELSIQFLDLDDVSTNNAGDFIKLKYSKTNMHESGRLFIGDKETEGSIGANEFYYNSIKMLMFNATAIGMSVVAVILSMFLLIKRKISVEKVFLYTIPILCIIYIMYIPMFTGHDEQRHWLRAYEISEGHLLTEINEGKVGTILPKSVISGINNLKWSQITYNSVVGELGKKLDSDNREIANMENVAVYSPIQYLPQSIGILIARLFTDKVLIMAYAARLMNAIVCIAILYLAIKKMPFGKNILLLCAYIPIVLEGICTLSADGITISICFLFISYVLNLVSENKKIINKKDIFILTALCIIIALCKIVYLPLIGLLLIIPKERFKSKKQKIVVVATIWLIAVICSLTWLGIANQYLQLKTAGSSTTKTIDIFRHPIQYLQRVLYTMNSDGQTHLVSLFGGRLTWSSISLITIVPYTIFVMFAFLSATDEKIKNRLSIFAKVISILIILAIVMLVYTSLYLQWTDDGNLKIAGVQGRYYIPFLPLLGLLIGNLLKIKNEYKEETITRTIGIIGVLLQVYAILVLAIAYIT